MLAACDLLSILEVEKEEKEALYCSCYCSAYNNSFVYNRFLLLWYWYFRPHLALLAPVSTCNSGLPLLGAFCPSIVLSLNPPYAGSLALVFLAVALFLLFLWFNGSGTRRT